MRRKTVIILSCITGFLALIILLGVLLFDVKDVYAEAYPNCTDEQRLAVTNSAVYVKGQSILFLNEEKLQQRIVSDNPNVEILGVERKFPSSVIVHFIPKYTCAYLAYDGGYYLLDNDMRVLKRVSQRPTETLIEMTTDTLRVTGIEVGQSIRTETGFETIADATFYALARIGYGAADEKVDCAELISRIDVKIQAALNNEIVTLYMRDGAIIEIYRVDKLFNEKVRLAVSVYVENDQYKGEGKCLVAFTRDGKAVVGAKEKV